MSEVELSWGDLLFSVRRSVRYHMRRSHFFDMWGKWTNGLNVVFGSAAVASIMAMSATHGKLYGTISGAIVAVVSVIDLIIGSSTVARSHADLAKAFIGLETKMALVEVPSEKALRESRAARLAIEANEPPVMRMLDVLCHNELAKSMGLEGDMFKVGFIRRSLAHLVPFNTDGLKTRHQLDEIKASKAPKAIAPTPTP